MKKIWVVLLVCILTLFISVDAIGAVHPDEENLLTDTWYALNPPPSPHYRIYYYVPYSNRICTNSEFYINNHSFVLMNVSDNLIDVTTNIKASVLFPAGIFIDMETNYGTIKGVTLSSLGYRLNLNDRGYVAISLDSAKDQEINGSGIVYDLDGEYLSDSYKITGEVRFCNNNIATTVLHGRLRVNSNIITGFDLDSSNEDYYLGLTWNPSSFMVFDSQVGTDSNNLKYAVSETFIFGKHRLGLEYEKLESKEVHQFTLKEKYLISNTSELVIKIGFGELFREDSTYEPLFLVAYQMNL